MMEYWGSMDWWVDGVEREQVGETGGIVLTLYRRIVIDAILQ